MALETPLDCNYLPRWLSLINQKASTDSPTQHKLLLRDMIILLVTLTVQCCHRGSDSSSSWLVKSHCLLYMADPATISSGQSVTLSKSLWKVSSYLPCHTLCRHEVMYSVVIVLFSPLLHFFIYMLGLVMEPITDYVGISLYVLWYALKFLFLCMRCIDMESFYSLLLALALATKIHYQSGCNWLYDVSGEERSDDRIKWLKLLSFKSWKKVYLVVTFDYVMLFWVLFSSLNICEWYTIICACECVLW